MAKQIVVDKINEYSDFRKELRQSETVALRLGFDIQAELCKRDIAWCSEVLDLLNSIKEEK